MKVFSRIIGFVFPALFAFFAMAADLPTADDITAQLNTAKKESANNADVKALVQDLEDTLALLNQIEQQKQQNAALNDQIQQAKALTSQAQKNIDSQKNNPALQPVAELEKISLSQLQKQLASAQNNLQKIQDDLTQINANLVAQNTAPDRAQTALTANLARTQEINKALLTQISASAKNKLNVELELITLKNNYNQMLLSGNAALTALYETQRDEKQLEEHNIQAQLTALQTVVNEKLLQASKDQVEVVQSQKETSDNAILAKELDINTRLSQELVKQTAGLNTLSQDNLRIKNVLDNLQQTQHTIDEQISALQGSLVLSRIINKQRQALPQDELISGLPKRISDLRLGIFDLTELRDNVFNSADYISTLQNNNEITFTDKERSSLEEILQERRGIVSNLITLLNSQLNLAINIELNQQQVASISEELQSKLEQQSFWVKSNEPIDFAWMTGYVRAVDWQLHNIKQKFNFRNWKDNLLPALELIAFLLLIAGFIQWKKASIKQHLAIMNGQLNTLSADTQWHTPVAIFLTVVLCLPSTVLFLTAFILVSYICFADPTSAWEWGFRMSAYWLFFAFILAVLRPNGLAIRHFNMQAESAALFRQDLKRSAWWVALFLNVSVFSNMDGTGIQNDMIGQTLTICALLISIFMMTPRFRRAFASYQNKLSDNTASSDRVFLRAVRFVMLIAPVVLIILVLRGYYYTTLTLINHLILTFNAGIIWLIAREVVYRSLTVSSRRLAYRRLQEKRRIQAEKLAAEKKNGNVSGDEAEVIDQKQDEIAVSQVRIQVSNVVNFLLWIGLFALLYWVWSDLVKVAYYLEGITLWKQNITTAAGTVTESITLFNVLVALVVLLITYLLVKNIAGILESLVFSRFSFSQGAPYTITTLLTYMFIALGAMIAFGILGISWDKLQWLFAALSVGLGFGLQEIFANFVSGIIILFERPARIGDFITIGSYSGTVSKIRIRATTLIDSDKKEVIVPNKAFVTERLVNWSLNNSITRLTISVGVAYGTDLELTKQLLLQAANESDKVLKDPAPVAYFLAFGASTLDHELRVHVGQIGERTQTIDFLNRRINELFAANNIDIAFNQLDIFIKNQATGEEIKIVEPKKAEINA